MGKYLTPDIIYSFSEANIAWDYLTYTGQVEPNEPYAMKGKDYIVFKNKQDIELANYCHGPLDSIPEMKDEETQNWKYLAFLLKKVARETEKQFYYINTKSLLFQFKTLDKMFWSMMFYEEEWTTNNLKEFRESFLNYLQQSSLAYQKLNSDEWLLNQINSKYNQFSSLKSYYSPNITIVVASLLFLGFLALMVALSGAPLVLAISYGLIFGVPFFGGGGALFYSEQTSSYRKEEDKFLFFCNKSKELLSGRIIDESKIPEGVLSLSPVDYLLTKRQENSLLNRKNCTFFCNSYDDELNSTALAQNP